ncbi:MAG: MFS transporter, partial [Acetobacteraceae bacterium]
SFTIGAGGQWMIYLPVLVVSIVLMVPLVILAERGGRMKEVFLSAIVVLLASVLLLGFGGHDRVSVLVGLVLFFAAFTVMEAMLPSLVSRFAPAEAKGTAMGIYSSAQFLGIFAGGALGGAAQGLGGARGVFIFAALVALGWLASAIAMPQPAGRKSGAANAARPG